MEVYNNDADREAYKMAQIKVKKLKNFYVHLIVYVLVNGFLLLSRYNNLDAHESFFTFHTFSTAFYWGIGLVAHGTTVFVPNFIFGKNWEDRKMKQFMGENKKSNWE
jgi:hypothetical protein